MNAEFQSVEWDSVRPGDVLMHENGDRLTVQTGHPNTVLAAEISRFRSTWKDCGFTPYRKAEPLPTTPGAYLDKDGKHWMLDTDGFWFGLDLGEFSAEDAAEFAPFTRLAPMPTKEQVHATVYNALRGSAIDGMYPLRTINAVMALFEQEADSE